jgi:exonuclease 3'-5' domain-containing protein 1
VRNDADALFHLYNIELANVHDLQVLEVAVRRSSKIPVRLVCGLGSAIERYVNPPAEWARIKSAGAALCFPDKGGSYDVVEQRPLDARIIAYAAQDVGLLFQLERTLEDRIGYFGQNWKARVASVSAARVREALEPYSGHGQHRALAPDV